MFLLSRHATHLFTMQQSNVISDDMPSSLILTLTKQVPDNQFTHLCIKTSKFNAEFFQCKKVKLKAKYIRAKKNSLDL